MNNNYVNTQSNIEYVNAQSNIKDVIDEINRYRLHLEENGMTVTHHSDETQFNPKENSIKSTIKLNAKLDHFNFDVNCDMFYSWNACAYKVTVTITFAASTALDMDPIEISRKSNRKYCPNIFELNNILFTAANIII